MQVSNRMMALNVIVGLATGECLTRNGLKQPFTEHIFTYIYICIHYHAAYTVLDILYDALFF